MATKDEIAIRKALAGQGYYPTLACWVGGDRGWVISYRFANQPGAQGATMHAKSANDARRQIADLGRNRRG